MPDDADGRRIVRLARKDGHAYSDRFHLMLILGFIGLIGFFAITGGAVGGISSG